MLSSPKSKAYYIIFRTVTDRLRADLGENGLQLRKGIGLREDGVDLHIGEKSADIFLAGPGGDDDRHGRSVLAEGHRQADGVDVAESGIEDDRGEFRAVTTHGLQRLDAVFRGMRDVFERLEQHRRGLQDELLVIDHQDLGAGRVVRIRLRHQSVRYRRSRFRQLRFGQEDRERGSALDDAVYTDPSAVGFDDGRDGGETETASDRLRGHVGIEETLEDLSADAGSVIRNREQHAYTGLHGRRGAVADQRLLGHLEPPRRDHDSSGTLADRLDRVLDDVHEHLEELVVSAVDIGDVLGNVEFQVDGLGEESAQDVLDLADHPPRRGALEDDARFTGVIHEFAHHHAAALERVADGVDRHLLVRIGRIDPGRDGGIADDGEDVVDVVGDTRGEKRERLALLAFAQALLGGEQLTVFVDEVGDVADEREREELVHLHETHVEMARRLRGRDPLRVLKLEADRLHAGIARENTVEHRLELELALGAEEELRELLAGNGEGNAVDVARILGHRHQPVLAVEDRERVGNSVDQRALTGLGLGDGERTRRDGLEHAVDGHRQQRELVLAAPLEPRTVGVAVHHAEIGDRLGHLGERVEQYAALEPEDRQHEDESHQRDEEREPPHRGLGYGREGLGDRDGHHGDGVAGDVTDRVDGLVLTRADLPEAARIEVDRLGEHRGDSEIAALLRLPHRTVRDDRRRGEFRLTVGDADVESGKTLVHLAGEGVGLEWYSEEHASVAALRERDVMGEPADTHDAGRRRVSLALHRRRAPFDERRCIRREHLAVDRRSLAVRIAERAGDETALFRETRAQREGAVHRKRSAAVVRHRRKQRLPHLVGVAIGDPGDVGTDVLDLLFGITDQMNQDDASADVEHGQRQQEQERGRQRITRANRVPRP